MAHLTYGRQQVVDKEWAYGKILQEILGVLGQFRRQRIRSFTGDAKLVEVEQLSTAPLSVEVLHGNFTTYLR